mmetsp:Transcript_9910/g.18683  ORF Transcript_9910/g.18683 Transcript_9910/m.18683 type:complete len:229 (+) Transcript_9910:107-793(+)|eukprot:CAMPEP_0203748884 /NCGR_PEP_ID=MMETSP0098-20131031/3643_1 /ASSEMBLY_ACC=CAM_ASM_000208 /TAXON_ID=96639 /ORGANISM=" , Strain NY0313808BC1" /LENGTH=228 /DNA_ID=CAMNT_0050637787 /DNA_START=73 /DNA_END=756 /DNA_ORIENTATION=-
MIKLLLSAAIANVAFGCLETCDEAQALMSKWSNDVSDQAAAQDRYGFCQSTAQYTGCDKSPFFLCKHENGTGDLACANTTNKEDCLAKSQMSCGDLRASYCWKPFKMGKLPGGATCSGGAVCISGECDCGRCHPVPTGGRCSTDANCASGGTCDGPDGPRTFGCAGTCGLLLLGGADCPGDGDVCFSGECDCGRCRPVPTGGDCSTDANCASGTCGGWITLGCFGNCE